MLKALFYIQTSNKLQLIAVTGVEFADFFLKDLLERKHARGQVTKTVPLTNLNKYFCNDKSEIKVNVNVNNSSKILKTHTHTHCDCP